MAKNKSQYDSTLNLPKTLFEMRAGLPKKEPVMLKDWDLSLIHISNNGQIKRVANSTFIITPYNVDIMGDLLDELEKNGAFY